MGRHGVVRRFAETPTKKSESADDEDAASIQLNAMNRFAARDRLLCAAR
jgi:hypothetical protein